MGNLECKSAPKSADLTHAVVVLIAHVRGGLLLKPLSNLPTNSEQTSEFRHQFFFLIFGRHEPSRELGES